MNILFIEDEKDLQDTGVMQLESLGHRIYPTSDIAESRALLADSTIKLDLIISDHRLPDGHGIEFLLEVKALRPELNSVIVSGCLTETDIKILKENKITYFHKPLLYRKVVEEVRRAASLNAPIRENNEDKHSEEPEAHKGISQKRRFPFFR